MVVIAISEVMGENALGRGLNTGEIKLVKLARSNQNGYKSSHFRNTQKP